MLSIDRAGYVIYERDEQDRDRDFWAWVKELFVPLDGTMKRWRLTIFPLWETYTFYADAATDFSRIDHLIKEASRHYIEVPQALAERMDEAEEAALTLSFQKRIKERFRTVRGKYEHAKKFGCVGCGGRVSCKYLVDGIDNFYCTAAKQYLDFKNIPTDHNGVRYLIHFVPFPGEGCVYNISKKEEEEVNERALQKLSELIHAAHAASGSEREELYKQISKLLVSEAEWEPLVIHNTDTWQDEKVEVQDE